MKIVFESPQYETDKIDFPNYGFVILFIGTEKEQFIFAEYLHKNDVKLKNGFRNIVKDLSSLVEMYAMEKDL